MTCVTGCENLSKSELNVTNDFKIGLLNELGTIEECCPYTAEVIKDWTAQNIE